MERQPGLYNQSKLLICGSANCFGAFDLLQGMSRTFYSQVPYLKRLTKQQLFRLNFFYWFFNVKVYTV